VASGAGVVVWLPPAGGVWPLAAAKIDSQTTVPTSALLQILLMNASLIPVRAGLLSRSVSD